jgi:glycerophosphoryl diester phosphodiesterase
MAREKIGDRVGVLALLPKLSEAENFLEAGAGALRLWETDAGSPEAARLKLLAPIWITAGGKGTGKAVGDGDAAGFAAILRCGPEAILVNDPALLVQVRGATA